MNPKMDFNAPKINRNAKEFLDYLKTLFVHKVELIEAIENYDSLLINIHLRDEKPSIYFIQIEANQIFRILKDVYLKIVICFVKNGQLIYSKSSDGEEYIEKI